MSTPNNHTWQNRTPTNPPIWGTRSTPGRNMNPHTSEDILRRWNAIHAVPSHLLEEQVNLLGVHHGKQTHAERVALNHLHGHIARLVECERRGTGGHIATITTSQDFLRRSDDIQVDRNQFQQQQVNILRAQSRRATMVLSQLLGNIASLAESEHHAAMGTPSGHDIPTSQDFLQRWDWIQAELNHFQQEQVTLMLGHGERRHEARMSLYQILGDITRLAESEHPSAGRHLATMGAPTGKDIPTPQEIIRRLDATQEHTDPGELLMEHNQRGHEQMVGSGQALEVIVRLAKLERDAEHRSASVPEDPNHSPMSDDMDTNGGTPPGAPEPESASAFGSSFRPNGGAPSFSSSSPGPGQPRTSGSAFGTSRGVPNFGLFSDGGGFGQPKNLPSSFNDENTPRNFQGRHN